jgi:RNA recognition motif-containing protein
MNKKLYVGNLSYNTTDSALQEFFEQVGPVASAVVIMDRMSGRSKGFGFVEMETEADAQQAVERLHNASFDGRNITVAEARPRTDSGSGFGGGGGGGRGGYGGGGRGGFDRDNDRGSDRRRRF